MTREMTERFMNLLDESHQRNPFVQPDGSVICRVCHTNWPCDMRQVIDAFNDLGKVLEIVSVLNMKAYGLISQLTENAELLQEKVPEDDGLAELINEAKAYLAVGLPS